MIFSNCAYKYWHSFHDGGSVAALSQCPAAENWLQGRQVSSLQRLSTSGLFSSTLRYRTLLALYEILLLYCGAQMSHPARSNIYVIVIS